MTWQDREVECAGSAIFAGEAPENAYGFFRRLEAAGIAWSEEEPAEGGRWHLALDHPEWGKAALVALEDMKPPPALLVDLDPHLTPDERQEVLSGGAVVTLSLESVDEGVLHERKRLLRYLHAVLGDDGLAAIDHVAFRIWSRGALEDELAHEAELDIEALYALHLVTPEKDAQPTWLHSHGLAELGFFDFDVLRPSTDLTAAAIDLTRAIAFAIVEERVVATTDRFDLAAGGAVRFVPVADFHERARREDAALRDMDEDHGTDRAVICDPPGRLARIRDKPRPSSFLSGSIGEENLIYFSNAASDLMARRARGTYPLFRRIAGELAEFGFPTIAKLGYVVDGGGPNDREHLWFDVHALAGETLDATLVSSPFGIERMKMGDRGTHPIELLSDWMLLTPAGKITPRATGPARFIRAHREEVRRALKDHPRG